MELNTKKIEEYRAKSMTQEIFTKKIGISLQNYNLFIKRKDCKLKLYFKICEVFQVPFNTFIDDYVGNTLSVNDNETVYANKNITEKLISALEENNKNLKEKLDFAEKKLAECQKNVKV